ncbi:zf-HC2 domain-containing protein [bacterium]|nr:zf-HC2 domain-containing protein [candidate division CSSED10-310 bacterium]
MECRTVEELLGLYVDGRLDPVEARQVRRHVESCAACATRLGLLLQERTATGGLQAIVVSREEPFGQCFSDDTMQRVLDGRLTAEEMEIAGAHIEACPVCAAACAAMAGERAGARLPRSMPSLKRLLAPVAAVAVTVVAVIVLSLGGDIAATRFPAFSYPQPYTMKGAAQDELEQRIVRAWSTEQWSLVGGLLGELRELRPDLPATGLFMGVALLRDGRPGEALDLLTEYCVRPDLGDLLRARFYLALAEACSDLNRCAETRQALADARRLHPPFGESIEAILVQLEQQGCD